MRIIVCHNGHLHPKTIESVSKHAPSAEFVDTSSDSYAYGRAIRENWNLGGDLVVIEQDNEITADTIPGFEACEHHWCTCPYQVVSHDGQRGVAVESLGCTRFSAELQRVVHIRYIARDEYVHWRQVVRKVSLALTLHGYQPHLHDPIPHHHDDADYDGRIERAMKREQKAMMTREHLDAMKMPRPAPNYWDTRYDLPERRQP